MLPVRFACVWVGWVGLAANACAFDWEGAYAARYGSEGSGAASSTAGRQTGDGESGQRSLGGQGGSDDAAGAGKAGAGGAASEGRARNSAASSGVTDAIRAGSPGKGGTGSGAQAGSAGERSGVGPLGGDGALSAAGHAGAPSGAGGVGGAGGAGAGGEFSGAGAGSSGESGAGAAPAHTGGGNSGGAAAGGLGGGSLGTAGAVGAGCPENRVLNPGFEELGKKSIPTHWGRLEPPSDPDGSFISVDTHWYEGERSLLLDTTALHKPPPDYRLVVATTEAYPVFEGKELYVSAQVWVVQAPSPLQMGVVFGDGDTLMNVLGATQLQFSPSEAFVFQGSAVLPVPAGATVARVVVIAGPDQVVYLDAVCLTGLG
ncbi:hypothetical protein ACFL5O_00570 [Myxococcota bacterium]